MKKCIKCGETKDLKEYYVHKASADGHLGKCKECCKKDSRKNRKEKVEYYRQYDKDRYQNDPRVRERHKKYQKTEKGIKSLRQSKKKWSENNVIKRHAHIIVRGAIRNGKLSKKPCEVCGKEKAHAHHDDYSRPLDVRWLCSKHHREWHKEHGEAKY